MQASHDHMAIGGWTRSGLAGCCVLAMAGCADTSPPFTYADGRDVVIDGVPMRAENDFSFVSYDPFDHTDPATGETITIVPTPSPPEFVVVRNDGQQTTEADRGRALQAAEHICRLDGGQGYRGQLRFETSPAGRPVWLMGACE